MKLGTFLSGLYGSNCYIHAPHVVLPDFADMLSKGGPRYVSTDLSHEVVFPVFTDMLSRAASSGYVMEETDFLSLRSELLDFAHGCQGRPYRKD